MGSKVSIIMPLYNAEKYVSKTIQSFVQQSYKDKELVIVDDCSTDGSYDVAVRYSRPALHCLLPPFQKGKLKRPEARVKLASEVWDASMSPVLTSMA